MALVTRDPVTSVSVRTLECGSLPMIVFASSMARRASASLVMLEKSRTQIRTPLWVVKVVRIDGERSVQRPCSRDASNVASANGAR